MFPRIPLLLCRWNLRPRRAGAPAMSETPAWLNDEIVRRRAKEIDRGSRRRIYQRTDRMFVALLLMQWVAGIIASLVITPQTWQGTTSSVHPHLWLAVFLGGALCSLPIYL